MESSNIKKELDIDPDYEINNTAIRKIEAQEIEENKLTSEKLVKIISEEFDKELSNRQKQLEEIEDKIFKAQTLLHLVRYVLVTSYYNKKSLEYKEEEDNSRPLGYDSQNRIHPAVKKLLGNSSLEIINSRGKRARKKNAASCYVPTAKKIKLEPKVSENALKPAKVDDNQNSLMNRKKTRHRIVVGNISKWMPSLDNDNTTHKWMVYVRGLKEAPDVSHIIDKVVFYLHPSYKPHDVVEVNESPFHLSRRGWGEFPLRVQIFFKCTMNKPVSIVHNLKLDKTFTGRQTLGNETLVDLYLYDDNSSSNEDIPRENLTEVKLEPSTETQFQIPNNLPFNQQLLAEEESLDKSIRKPLENIFIPRQEHSDTHKNIQEYLASTSFQQDYLNNDEIIEEQVIEEQIFDCSMDLEEQVVPAADFVRLDHSYSLLSDQDESITSESEKYKQDLNDQSNKLIFGLDNSYLESNNSFHTSNNNKKKAEASKDKFIVKTLTTSTGLPIRFLPQSFNKILLTNGNIVQVKLLQKSLLKKNEPLSQPNSILAERKIDYEKFKVKFPKNRFRNMGEALPYLFKRLLLYTDLARNIDYKCTYPFTAESMEEFDSWDIGKRLCAEWSRAKAVKDLLEDEPLPDRKEWNTKGFFMYARSHGFSPLPPHGTILKTPSRERDLLMSCFSKLLPQKALSASLTVEVDVNVDVDSDGDSDTLASTNAVTDISDPRTRYERAFVREAARDCGVILKSEELAEGIAMSTAEVMMLEAVRCFAEGLVRRARHHLVCREDFREETDEITINEIKLALGERSCMKSIMNFQEEKRKLEFFL